MARNTSDLHIVMLPWSAFGHMIPFYQLAIALANKGVRVSYITTPKNIDRLPKIPSELTSLVHYVSIPLPTPPPHLALPEKAEATVDIEFNEIPYLKTAYDLLYEPVKDFVLSQTPDWLLSDVIAHWMPDVARECRAKLMLFSVYTANIMSFLGPSEYLSVKGQKEVRATPDSLTTTPHWGKKVFPPTIAFRGYEAVTFHTGFYSINEISDAERTAEILKGCDAVAFRSCREFEGEYFDLYQKLVNKPVLPVGLLPPPKVGERENNDGKWSEVFEWLDQQNPESVIYVGFGSEYKLTKNEVYEIAYGLELAQLPFIWALRKPTWAVDDSDALPPGFVNRTSGKGIVCLGWAPQLEILAHPSVGGSLFHSGWGSIIETLQHGHTLILLPFIIDQGLNARMIVEKGLGIEVDRREDGSYTRDDIAFALKQAMIGDKAQKIKAEAKKAAAFFGDKKPRNDRRKEELSSEMKGWRFELRQSRLQQSLYKRT